MVSINQALLNDAKHAYLIGIGGVGMSSLARVLKHQGLKVSGSDLKESKTTKTLNREGIEVHIGQKTIQLKDADLVIYSTAIRPQHIELSYAREMGVPVYHRAEVLSSIFNHADTSIAVTGTHGKTTTSSMISFILSSLSKNPTCMIGGDMLNLGTNAILGSKNLWVAEVDESDKSHELFCPNYAVLTNLEEDHLDHYNGMSDIEASFARFLANVKKPGVTISCKDDEALSKLVEENGSPTITYGLSPDADFSAQNITMGPEGSSFDLMEAGFYSDTIRLNVPGIHNIVNALAAITLLIHLGVDLEDIKKPLENFKGAKRRLEIKYSNEELFLVDDYAHHPTEVRSSIQALRTLGKRLTVIFQPHRYSRTKYFMKEFAEALAYADHVIVTDIFSAGEPNDDKVYAESIVDIMKRKGFSHAEYLSLADIDKRLNEESAPTGIYAFLGAGDIGETVNGIARRFKSYTSSKR